MCKGLVLPEEQGRRGIGRWLLAAFLLLLVVSYFNGGFVANGIRDFLIAHVMAPLHLIKENTIDHFANVMAGFEEMAIYWLSIFFPVFVAEGSYGAFPKNTGFFAGTYSGPGGVADIPEVRYAGFLFGLAFFNNLVMLGAPTFPARATFGSVVMILIGGVAILRSPVIWQRLQAGRAGHVLPGRRIGSWRVYGGCIPGGHAYAAGRGCTAVVYGETGCSGRAGRGEICRQSS